MSFDTIFKAYDIRGVVPDQLDDEMAHAIGIGFARFASAPVVAVGHDCRVSSPSLADALIRGITSQGTDVRLLGEITTDMLYYYSGVEQVPGAVITASHNPGHYNGMKFCLAGAAPVGADTGLGTIKKTAAAPPASSGVPGAVVNVDALPGYVDHVLGVVDPSRFGSLRIAVDGGNGMAGVALPSVFDRTPLELIGLYLEPDGTFPNHPADPLQPENLADLIALMEVEQPDLGVAFDGDADRAFFVDDKRVPVPGSTVTALVARWFLDSHPGASIVHNLICSKAVPETVRRFGGTPVRTRVGHSFIKQVMKETDAVFGGEHSGHYYFRDNFRADSGILTMLVLLQVLSEDGRTLSELRREYEPYAQSGEINFTVEAKVEATDAVEREFPGATTDRLDGLTVDMGDRWFNLRPSNTEPVLRLNVEAPDRPAVDALVDEVSSIIREYV